MENKQCKNCNYRSIIPGNCIKGLTNDNNNCSEFFNGVYSCIPVYKNKDNPDYVKEIKLPKSY